MIDGRHFGDWVPQGHGTLPDLNEALAQSCNVFFADVGLRLGLDRLRHFMTSAGFDAQTNLGLFTVPLGRTRGEIFNKFETAFYAIGLEHETITTLRHAMPPAALQSTVSREYALLDGQLRLRGVLDGGAVPVLQADVPPDLAHARLAPLVLWPLVQWLVSAQPGATGWTLSALERRSAAGKPRLALRLRSDDARWPADDTVLAVLRTRLVAVHGTSAQLNAAPAAAGGVDIELDVPLKQVEAHDPDRIDR